ncbi:hypothetical protein Salat_1803000 [Sesamum alatum]|uniref:Uncharacterized protein n=1 Tax=Sesamum alatum TaxID=300844 RepID=A0AAE2CHE8_9LAMI|nr:hypothetical protein Salat_1803000 [Sesamum alatum]
MKISRFLARTWMLILFILFSPSRSQGQTVFPPAGLLCISDCETCPVICSPPPPPATPKSSPPPPPPPPVHHSSPPLPYYFDSPAPSSPPPAHPLPPPPSYISWGGSANPPPPPPPSTTPKGGGPPPPPSVNVYNPGMGQRNFSYPYYYFYASKAASCLPLLHQSFILLMLFIFFQILY